MKAAVVSSFAEPPKFADFADPVAGEGEVVVTVAAAGLHQIVKSLAKGQHYGSTGELPFIPGVDGVGRLQDGTRVFFGAARSPYGTMAERTLAANWMCTPVPDELDDATAAGIANPAMSSWVALMRGSFAPNDSVLILGATGVAGRLAVQVAKRRGARRVVAAGRNPQALAELKALGADETVSLELDRAALVDTLRAEFAGAGVDVVLDYLWGAPAEACFEAFTQRGLQKTSPRVRYVQIGNIAGPSVALQAATLRSSGLEILGSGFGSASMKQILGAVADFFAAAALHPFVFSLKAIPLSQVQEAWAIQQDGVRVVLQP